MKDQTLCHQAIDTMEKKGGMPSTSTAGRAAFCTTPSARNSA